jgi:AraC-like DNA-binding protein
MFLDKINKWIIKFKPYFFSYSDGFFKFYYLANSPELLVNSIKKMPTVTCDENSNTIYLSNSFLKSSLRYIELEKGLWLLNANVFFKNNIMYEAIYDTSLPADYYCLTINLIQNEYASEFYKFGSHTISNYSINFLKPLKEANNYHFKGSNEVQYVVYFSEEWMKQNIIESKNTPQNFLELIHNQEVGFATFSISKEVFDKILNEFALLFNENVSLDTFKIKLQTYQFFELFFASFDTLQSLHPDKMKGKDIAMFEKIEHHLMSNIYGKFPGIEELANRFSISPTKLKTDFKILYGTSIFNYFQTKQMELAYQILVNEDLKIKEVASLFRYENASKFTKTFEKINKIRPSQLNI